MKYIPFNLKIILNFIKKCINIEKIWIKRLIRKKVNKYLGKISKNILIKNKNFQKMSKKSSLFWEGGGGIDIKNY